MKKIKFVALSGAQEVLTRDELRNVLGGTASGGSGGGLGSMGDCKSDPLPCPAGKTATQSYCGLGDQGHVTTVTYCV